MFVTKLQVILTKDELKHLQTLYYDSEDSIEQIVLDRLADDLWDYAIAESVELTYV